MADTPTTEPKGEAGRDFIRDIVQADVDAGRAHVVVTRFPPEPNGFLHLGHAKSICLNFGVAQEFGGSCHLRFDDTNPVKEEQVFIDSMQRDVKWLGFDWGEHLYHASDYFEQLYAWAEHLIRTGHAYVDDTPSDQMRAQRGTLTEPGQNSPHRYRSVDENLGLFHDMRAGKFPNGACVLRDKIDMTSGNMNLRDPVLYRILHATHPRTGDAWCIYPTYDFAHGQSDAIEGITHSICTLEFEDHKPLYDWFLDHLPVPARPRQYEFARLNVTYTVLSKRILTALVRVGQVSGWDDPRMPTLAGIRRRGVPAAALREFIGRVGVARANSMVDVAMFDAAVRDTLNPTAPRRMAVLRPLKLIIDNYADGKTETLDAINHPDDPSQGTRSITFGRELHGKPAKEILPLVAGERGAAALRLLRHLPIRRERCRWQRDSFALHLRSANPRRQCPPRWAQGEGDAARARGGGRGSGGGPALQPFVQPARSRRRRRGDGRSGRRFAGGADRLLRGTRTRGVTGRRSGAVRAHRLLLRRPGRHARTTGVQPDHWAAG